QRTTAKGGSHFLGELNAANVWLVGQLHCFHRKAEASFAHSKRFAQYDIAVHVGASIFEGATEPRGSVWSARSLLPLWRVDRQHCSLRDSIPGHIKSESSQAGEKDDC